jgi:hypothetical protein
VILRERFVPGKPYKVIQDTITCPQSGRAVTRTLEVYGSKGPVQPSDEDVLIALIQFTHEYLASSPGATLIITDAEILQSGGDPMGVMMRLRKIHFKRSDLLKRLGITHLSGKNQQLVEQRMHRLSGVDLSVRNAYFQADGTLVTSVGLRLIDSYAFVEGNRYGWFAWSPTMAQLIENGELRALDTDFYFRINDFLARRLFRHLNIFGRPGRTVYSFAEIVKTRLGLEPSTDYVSKCKDPVERACRELVRLGFLRSYSIDGRFVGEATITLEMPDDYEPSETFSLPFEALIDSFRKEAGDGTEPVARGGEWQRQCARLERLVEKSPKARQAALELRRAVHDRHGVSVDALRHAVDTVQRLVRCGIRPHTAAPEVRRLVEQGAVTPHGVDEAILRVFEWWAGKRQRGEQIGPGLLVTALRDPACTTTTVLEDPVDCRVPAGPDEPPRPSPHASQLWQELFAVLAGAVTPMAVRDWLEPLVPVDVVVGPTPCLELWAPSHVFESYLTGDNELAVTLRREAGRLGVRLRLHAAE